MIITSADDANLQLLRAHSEQISALGRRHAALILMQQPEGNPRQVGTGFFFQCGAEWFLVTASHVAEDLLPGGYKAVTASGGVPADTLLVPGADGTPVALSCRRLSAARDEDVAVFHLNDCTYVRDRWAPTTLNDLLPADEPLAGMYHFAGWPLELTKRGGDCNVVSRYSYSTVTRAVVDGEPLRLRIDIDRNGHLNFDKEPGAVPMLKGISGCPIWRIFGLNDRRFAPKLVGVQTSYVDHGLVWSVRGTQWPVFVRLIRQQVPGLIEAAAGLLRPEPLRLV